MQLLIASLVLVLLFGVSLNSAQLEQQPGTLRVVGSGKANANSSIARISLGVTAQAQTAIRAQRMASDNMSLVIAAVQGIPTVKNLQTVSIGLSPIYSQPTLPPTLLPLAGIDLESQTPRLLGFSATNIISFEVDNEDAGEAIDAAVGAGATDINSITFITTPEDEQAAQTEAINAAIEDALSQVPAVRDSALSLCVTETQSVDISVSSGSPPFPIFSEAAFGASSTPVLGGITQITASATIVFNQTACSGQSSTSAPSTTTSAPSTTTSAPSTTSAPDITETTTALPIGPEGTTVLPTTAAPEFTSTGIPVRRRT